jgi:lambda family phage portal protein
MGRRHKKRRIANPAPAKVTTVEAESRATANQTTRLAHAYRILKAKYDAAQTTEDNRKHWAAADSLSATGANSRSVRQTLRNRSRYEVANNCYARGIVNTMAAYTVGAGPTLQLTWRGERLDPTREIAMRAAAQRVETLWANWAYARRLTQKLTTAVMSMVVDGEAFALLGNAKRASVTTPVQLDCRMLECDWFDDPSPKWNEDDSGVRIDGAGDPTEYAKLRQHPGDNGATADMPADWISADSVFHMFRAERPGQLRGIPQTTAALPLFSQLRRFILATITAAETAADFAAILYGDAPADVDATEVVEAWDRVEIERGAMLTAPAGSRLAQLKAEHPNTTFDEFVKAILREIARCLGVPAVIALGDASAYNYASGRLDLQSFNRQMAVDRSQVLEREFLDRLWEEWLDEALLIPGFLPPEFAATAEHWEFGWRWSEPEHVDRSKEASGQAQELASLTTTLSREYARRGLDWETELRQIARERSLIDELGITPPTSPAPAAQDPNSDPAADPAGDPAADPTTDNANPRETAKNATQTA